MISGELVWGGVAALVVFLELVGVFGKSKGDTITEMTRKLFKTDSKAGRIAFLVLWPAFAVWFLWHILWEPEWRRRRKV